MGSTEECKHQRKESVNWKTEKQKLPSSSPSNEYTHTLLAGSYYSRCGNTSAFSLKTKYDITMRPTIALLGIYPREVKTYVHTNNCVGKEKQFSSIF